MTHQSIMATHMTHFLNIARAFVCVVKEIFQVPAESHKFKTTILMSNGSEFYF